MTQEARTFTIPASAVGAAEAKVAKVNRRAAKLGVAGVTMTVVRTFSETDPDTKAVRELAEVAVSGEVKLAGWEFVAALDLMVTDEGPVTIIRARPEWETELPAEFRTIDPSRCDHCRLDRQRKRSFVLRGEDGGFVAVGSTCLGDFLGVTPDMAIAALGWELDVASYLDGLEGSYGEPEAFDVESFVAVANMIARAFGWKSRKMASQDGGTATATDAMSYMFRNTALLRELREQGVTLEDQDYEAARTQLAWAEETIQEADVDTLNDYQWNLRVALSTPVTYRTAGLVASVRAAYRFATEQRQERERQERESSPAPEGRVTMRGTVVSTDWRESDYGTQAKMLFRADEGFRVWSTVPAALLDETSLDALVGATIQFTAKLTPSRDDKFFAFASRPSKATIIELSPAVEEQAQAEDEERVARKVSWALQFSGSRRDDSGEDLDEVRRWLAEELSSDALLDRAGVEVTEQSLELVMRARYPEGNTITAREILERRERQAS